MGQASNDPHPEQQTWGSLQSQLVDGAIDDNDQISDADAKALAEFESRMRDIEARCGRFEASYRETLLNACEHFATEVGDLAAVAEDSSDGHDAVTSVCKWTADQEASPYTQETYLSSLRVFGHAMRDYCSDDEFDDEELPEWLADVDPGQYTRDLDPTPLPSEVLSYEEAIAMAEQSDKPRDKALVMMQWSAGLRPMCELFPLKYKHIEDMGTHYKINVPAGAKTGSRTVYIYAGYPLLKRWIEQAHPAHLESEPDLGPETRIWTKHNRNEPLMQYQSLASVFRRCGTRAGVEKDTSPQNLRRSAASYVAAKADSDHNTLNRQFGWSENSNVGKHYIAQFAESQKIQIAKCYGHDIDEDETPDPTAPVSCERCERWTTRGFEHCIYCEHPIDEEIRTLEESIPSPGVEKDVVDLIVDGDLTPEAIRAAPEIASALEQKPDFLDRIEKYAQLAERQQDDASLVVTGIVSGLAWASGRATEALAAYAQLKKAAVEAHPDWSYPGHGRMAATAGVAGLWILFVATVLVPAFTGDVLAGDSTAVSLLAVAVGVVVATALRDLPGIDQAPDVELRAQGGL